MSKVLVYGLGVSGVSAVKLLMELGEEVAVFCDGYCDCPDGVENRSDYTTTSAIMEDIDYLVISPGISYTSPLIKLAKKRNIPILPEIELASRHCAADIIAITGTNGKTTSVELMAKMLEEYGINAYKLGNIGESFSSKALSVTASDVAVVEASSFQLEGVTTFKPKYAICLNIAEDHLERHKSMCDYINAKAKIFAAQDDRDYAILNYDDENCTSLAHKMAAKTYFFSRKAIVKGSYVCGGNIYFREEYPELVCSVSDIRMDGEHNLENALACITVAKLLHFPNSVIVKAVNSFTPPRHRVEYIGSRDGVCYYNDSKATNCASTLVACRSMVGRTTLILGGYDKGLSYKPLFDNLPLKVSTVICYGANKESVINEAVMLSSITVLDVVNLEQAVNIASRIKTKNVLFSPATSSFDSFKNFEERGDYFVKLVKAKISEK